MPVTEPSVAAEAVAVAVDTPYATLAVYEKWVRERVRSGGLSGGLRMVGLRIPVHSCGLGMVGLRIPVRRGGLGA